MGNNNWNSLKLRQICLSASVEQLKETTRRNRKDKNASFKAVESRPITAEHRAFVVTSNESC